MNSLVVAPSMLACDFARVAEQVALAERAGGDWLHLDIMDGHFVDNISFGPAFAKAVAGVATVPLDVHLMIEEPLRYVPRFAPFAKTITVHQEVAEARPALEAVRKAGCGVGLALHPDTPVEAAEPFLREIDLLLVMTVVPGFGGQEFLPSCLEKVRQADVLRRSLRASFRIEVDGGINAETSRLAREAGADTLVAGTFVFGAKDPAAAVASLRG